MSPDNDDPLRKDRVEILGLSCLSHGRGDGTRFEQSESPFRRRANFPAGAGEHSPARPSIGSRHAGEGAACGRKRLLQWASWGAKPAGVPRPPRIRRAASYVHAPTTPPRASRRKLGSSDVAWRMTFARQDAGAGTAGNFKANLRITWARPNGRAFGRSPRIERGALVRCMGERLERLRSRGVRPCSEAAVETLKDRDSIDASAASGGALQLAFPEMVSQEPEYASLQC